MSLDTRIEESTVSGLANPTVNVRIVLAFLWVSHFILWIFGDMFALLQQMNDPVTDATVLFVAPTTAIVLTLVVAYTLMGQPERARMANLVAAPIYLLFNVVFFVDANHGWEYYLGVFYVLFAGLIFWKAYTWPKGSST